MDTIAGNNSKCDYTSELEKLLIEAEEKIKDLSDNLARVELENANLKYCLQLNQNSHSAEFNDGAGSLGIQILPAKDGLIVQGIQPGGRVHKDGRLSVGDIIVGVNDMCLSNSSFDQAQKLLKDASQDDTFSVRFMKYPSINTNNSTTPSSTPSQLRQSSPGPVVEPPVTPRRLGKKYHVRLVKGIDGLGFSITTKDNPAGDPYPVFIKSILSKGAAIEDGTLKSGDRLIQVNRVDLSFKGHADVVSFLKNIEVGSSVDLIIARHESDNSPIPSLPRPLPGEKGGNIPISRQSEVFTFEIQSNDTSSAGLGISVKGLIDNFGCDIGLFVNKIIHGGAASKDGRLKVNDQIISVNGTTLLGLSNDEAFKLMQNSFSSGACHEVNPNSIVVTIARRLQSSDSESEKFPRLVSESNHEDGVSVVVYDASMKEDLNLSNASYKSGENTVIYKPNDQLDAHFNTNHPVSNRLHGRTPSTGDKVTSEANKMTNGDLSPNRHDVHIEEDSETESSIHQTIPKSIEAAVDEEDSGNPLKAVESIVSLMDESESVFTRDGFGRQSMSEKRHATLNAKNTDTYQRNKKAREERERQRMREEAERNELINHSSPEIDPMSNINCTSTPQHHHNKHHSQSQQKSETPKQPVKEDSCRRLKPPRGEKSASKNPPLFSPKCCWSCQSPGSCPYHVAPHKSTRDVSSSGDQSRVGPNLGLKKSCSLESLQTMMQELQKDQLDGQEGNPFAGPRPATLKVSRSRTTNESFRAAVDKSFDGLTPQQAMETLSEEGSESNTSLNIIQQHHQQQQQLLLLQQQQQQQHQQQHQSQQQQYHHQQSLNLHQIQDNRLSNHPHNGENFSSKPSEAAISTTTGTSSQFTSGDDDVTLIKRKNSGTKKGLIKTLFRIGSGKKVKSSKNHSNSINSNNNKSDPEELNKLRARQAAQSEQERIQEHLRRFKEQQQLQLQHHHQQQQQQQQQQQYHHQSHPQQQPHSVQIFHQPTLIKSPINLPNSEHLPLTHFSSDPTIQYNHHQHQPQKHLQSPPPQIAPHQSQIQSQPAHTLANPSAIVGGQQAMKLSAHAGVIYGSTRLANHVRTPSGRMSAAAAAAASVRRQYPVEIQERVDNRYERTRLPPQQHDQVIDLQSSMVPNQQSQHAGYYERPLIQTTSTSTMPTTIIRPSYGSSGDTYGTYDTPYGAIKRNVYPGNYRSATVDRNFNRSTIYWGSSSTNNNHTGGPATTRTIATDAASAAATLRRPHSVYVDEYGRASIKRLGQRKVGDLYSYPPRHIT